MSWKNNIQVCDLDVAQQIEASCQRCGHTLYYSREQLMTDDESSYRYLDEVENMLVCRKRGCTGKIRIAMTHARKMSGFVGGMA